jgi:hypothetical protein
LICLGRHSALLRLLSTVLLCCPAQAGPDQVLAVLGGPMGVGDIGDPRWPWLAGEVELLRHWVERPRPLLGTGSPAR